MKIAIAIDCNFVSAHFGKCQEFLIADVRGSKLINTHRIPNPGHAPGTVTEFLRSKGIQRIICGGIGSKAMELFNSYGVQVIAGVTGNVYDALESFKNGTIIANGKSLCVPGTGKDYESDNTVYNPSQDD